MEKKNGIKTNEKGHCKVDGCTGTVRTNGYCSKHSNDYYRANQEAGVYIITLKDKSYIGMSTTAIVDRIRTERSRLITDNPQSVSGEMLNYFNSLCKEESTLSREEIADKYFDYDIIEGSLGWYKVDEDFNRIEFKDDSEKREAIFKIGTNNNSEVKSRQAMLDYYWKMREHYWIKHHKNLDKQNGTQNCLNIKD